MRMKQNLEKEKEDERNKPQVISKLKPKGIRFIATHMYIVEQTLQEFIVMS